ncbi:MAG: T9SS type A sorting domain-containing protein [Bacteroidales bacterium]|nr:T9SS type A sorting domain-containing protein [Bacteroidales bacterium]
MRKIVLVVSMVLLFAKGYAQQPDCNLIPYKPNFGVPGEVMTDTVGWMFFSNSADIVNRSSLWQFRSVAAEGDTIFPFLRSEYFLTDHLVTIFSSCIELDQNKMYELKFTSVALTPEFTNNLTIYLATYAPSYRLDETHGFGNSVSVDTFRIVVDSLILPVGIANVSLLIDPANFPPTATDGKYRLIFRSRNTSVQQGTAPNFYGIPLESYLKHLEVREADPYRLNVVAMTSPLSNCDLSNQRMSFKVRNLGYDMPSEYTVYYQYSADEGISFSSPIGQTFYTSIPYDSAIEVNFTIPQSFNTPVTLVNAWVEFPGQIQPSDTLRNVEFHQTSVEEVPYSFSFDNYSVFRNWSTISQKPIQPYVTWELLRNNTNTLIGQVAISTGGEASDDRLVTGCMELEQNKTYQISFTYKAFSNSYAENLKLYVGRSKFPQASDITLMDLRAFNNTEFRTITTYYTPSQTGLYFFGFLAYSAALSSGIALSEFSITEAMPPVNVPVYKGFESYDSPTESWQIYSQNAIDSAYSPYIFRGWTENTSASNVFTGNVGMITYSSPDPTAPLNSIRANRNRRLERNNNWIVSPPIFMEADKPYEILYFRRVLVAPAEEILNIRVSNYFDLQGLMEAEPLLSDTMTNGDWVPQKVYFTPTQTGTYFVTFQYNSRDGRNTDARDFGMALDDIAIRDSVSAQDTNLSVIRLTIPDPSCSLGNRQHAVMTVKNRSPYTIPAGTVSGTFAITNPAGNTTVVEANSPSTGKFAAILPYNIGTISYTAMDLRTQGAWEVEGWISGLANTDISDDTSAIVQTANTGTHTGRYDMGFEPHEKINHWSNSQAGMQQFWLQYVTNPAEAHTGIGAVYQAPTQGIPTGTIIRQSLTSPCFELSEDTTYFISFYYRAINLVRRLGAGETDTMHMSPVTLNVYAGTNRLPIGSQLQSTFSTTDTSYRRAIIYYKPDAVSAANSQYVVIEAVSERWSTGLYLDEFVIMDSISASSPNLSLDRIWAVSSNNCDLSPDTLYVEFQNQGYVATSDPIFEIEFGGNTYYETWYGDVPIDTVILFKLDQMFTRLNYGEDSVRISIVVPNNIAANTTRSIKKIKTAPITQLPYTVTFQPDERQGWNNLVEPFSVEPQNFAYWTFEGSEANALARFRGNGTNPGVLASVCFDLEEGEQYVIEYRYRTQAPTIPENLQVLRDSAGIPTDVLFSGPTVPGTLSNVWRTERVPFDAKGGGQEQFRFLSNPNYQSQGIFIDHFTMKEDTMAWPADVAVLEILAPVSDTNLLDLTLGGEPIIVKIANLNKRPFKNLPVYFSITGGTIQDGRVRDATIPELLSYSTLITDDPSLLRANLGEYTTYEIKVWVDVPGDLDRSNDTAFVTVTNINPSTSIVDKNENYRLMIYPNPATTEVFIKSEREISTLYIYDLAGHRLKEIRINHTEYQLNTGDLPTGVYLFSLQIDHQRILQRVVIHQQP